MPPERTRTKRIPAVSTEHDFAAFKRELPTLLAVPENVEKYALIHAEKTDSIWPTFEEAAHAGYERFGVEPFLVQHIVEKETPRYFSRRVAPWPSSQGK